MPPQHRGNLAVANLETIADFRSDNRAAFRAVFRQFTLHGRELLAVDGTRIKAVNNKDRNFTKNSLEKFIKAVDKRLDEYLRRLVTFPRFGGHWIKRLGALPVRG
jgi:hypothetical protein